MVKMSKEETLRWYTHNPRPGYPPNSPERCSYSVHNDGRSVGFHQCTFGIKETVEGYGFCKRHATAIKEALAR